MKFFCLALALTLCGCSSFNRDWEKAKVPPVNENSMAGPWEGTWSSDMNHHHGGLRCLMTPATNSVYQARFRATYGKFFWFNYEVPMEVQPHFGGWEFSADADLGKMAGGNYYFEGRVTTTNLMSTYRSSSDHGVFELRRPEK